MLTFEEAAPLAFAAEPDGRYVFGFGEPLANGQLRYSLELEPMIGGGYLIALYERREGYPYPNLILRHKIPVMPILRDNAMLGVTERFTCTCGRGGGLGSDHGPRCPMKVWDAGSVKR